MAHTKYLLYGHGGSYNHGAEAVTRATIAHLRRLSPGCHITLSTHFADQDREFALPADAFAERDMRGGTNAGIYAPTIGRITPDCVCIHVGGDNYCYRNWQRWAEIHYAALERGAKSVLWSCSIDPGMIDDEMLAALRTHHLITVRESVTYNALMERGLENAVRVSDIAFALEPEPVDCDLRNFVAINVSPLVMRKNACVFPAFQALIEYILNETDMDVLLVPHVVQPVDNDYDALTALNTYGANRVRLVSDRLSAAQYKHMLGSARFSVAARTHAAIAAYSRLVPALAIGYSAKSEGIAADLGMREHVLPVDRIVDRFSITAAFRTLMRCEAAIREELAGRMPQYLQNALPKHELWEMKGFA